jgi:hypothetical protein
MDRFWRRRGEVDESVERRGEKIIGWVARGEGGERFLDGWLEEV